MIRQLAAKVGFVEGPVWTGERLFVASISRGILYEIPLAGGRAVAVAELTGGPNGSAQAADGSIWIAQNGGHVIRQLSDPVVPPGIQRWSDDGVGYVVRSGVQAPNDLAFGPDGALWFTDPHPRLSFESPKPGHLCRLDPGATVPDRVLSGRPHPNGLAFSADGQTLYLVETIPRHVLAFPVIDGRTLGEPANLVTFDGEPDGIALDSDGRIYVACHGTDDAVMVCEPDGAIVERIALEHCFPTNLCFAGADLRTLVVTAPPGGRVLAIERDSPGLRI